MSNGAPMDTRYSRQFLKRLYYTMYMIRQFENTGIKLYRKGAIQWLFFIPISARKQLRLESAQLYENRTTSLAPIVVTVTASPAGRRSTAWSRNYWAKTPDICRGRGGSMHIADMTTGNLGANGIVGAGFAFRRRSCTGCIYSRRGSSGRLLFQRWGDQQRSVL